MKSTVISKDSVSNWDTATYPCMGYTLDRIHIVLFRSPGQGTVINRVPGKLPDVCGLRGYELGDHCSILDMNKFIPVPKGTKVVLEA